MTNNQYFHNQAFNLWFKISWLLEHTWEGQVRAFPGSAEGRRLSDGSLSLRLARSCFIVYGSRYSFSPIARILCVVIHVRLLSSWYSFLSIAAEDSAGAQWGIRVPRTGCLWRLLAGGTRWVPRGVTGVRGAVAGSRGAANSLLLFLLNSGLRILS